MIMGGQLDGLCLTGSLLFANKIINRLIDGSGIKLDKPVGDVVCSLLTIGNALFALIFLQSCSLIHESGLDNPFQRYGHSKFSKMTAGHLKF